MHQLHKAQITEGGSVWIDGDDKVMYTVTEPGAPSHAIDLSPKWSSVDPMLMYLKSKRLVEQTGLEHFNLSYDGFHYGQTIITNIVRFLFTSIVVPAVVAALTTLISLWLNGVFM